MLRVSTNLERIVHSKKNENNCKKSLYLLVETRKGTEGLGVISQIGNLRSAGKGAKTKPF